MLTDLQNNNTDLANKKIQMINEMETKCNKIAEQFFKFKNKIEISCYILQQNYIVNDGGKMFNTNFDDIELIEENLDELFYHYKLIKNNIYETRDIRLNIEQLDNKIQ